MFRDSGLLHFMHHVVYSHFRLQCRQPGVQRKDPNIEHLMTQPMARITMLVVGLERVAKVRRDAVGSVGSVGLASLLDGGASPRWWSFWESIFAWSVAPEPSSLSLSVFVAL